MKRIQAQSQEDRELAEGVLCWIKIALRPLSITELRHALAIENDDSNMNLDGLPFEEKLTPVCAELVTIDRESNIVRFVHTSHMFPT